MEMQAYIQGILLMMLPVMIICLLLWWPVLAAFTARRQYTVKVQTLFAILALISAIVPVMQHFVKLFYFGYLKLLTPREACCAWFGC